MRKLICMAALLALAGCGSNTGPDVDLEGAFVTTPVEVTLQFGEDLTIEGTVLRMSFAAVLGDSRCPSDVVCVWEGNAEVEIGIAAGMGPTQALQLNTTLDPRAVEWSEMLVTLLEVTPYPVSGVPIDDADYTVKLRLEPMS